MAKLVITLDGVVVREFPLTAGRVSIGRLSQNDIQLDDASVSGEHAAILVGAGVALTDLNSTNGTKVNGDKVDKVALNHGDVIRISRHELTFIDEVQQDLSATMVLEPQAVTSGVAMLTLLTGAKQGAKLTMKGERLPLGKPGGELAVIIRKGEGYQLVPIAVADGRLAMSLNDEPLSGEPVSICDGDVVEIGSNRVLFSEG